MRRIVAFVLFCVLVNALAQGQLKTRTDQTQQPSEDEPAAGAKANSDPLYVQLRHITLQSEAIPVKDFTLKRDVGTFVFKAGAFHLLVPVNGKVTGAVFTGEATFSLKPPIEVERRYLSTLTKGQPFEEEFSGAVFRFTDGTEEEIKSAAAKDAGPASGDPHGLLSDIQQQLRKKLKENLDVRLLQDVMRDEAGGKFVAFIKGKKYSDKEIFDVDPHGVVTYLPVLALQPQFPFSLAPEEVALTLWDPNHEGIWASFHYGLEYSAGIANSDEQNQTFAIQHQKLDTTIDKRAYLTGNAQTTVVALENGLRVIPLRLFPTLRVESVIGEDHQQLSFIQEPKFEDADFAVILPKPLRRGEKYTITTRYKGKDAVSNEGGGNYFPIARENWYPSQGFGQYATYAMTFHIPKGLKIIATGKRLKDTDEGDENITEWDSEVPQAVAGFNFGKFKRDELKLEGRKAPDGKQLTDSYLLEAYVNPEAPAYLNALTGPGGGDGGVAGPGGGQGGVTPRGLGVNSSLSEASALGTFSTTDTKKAMAEAQVAVQIYTEYFGEASYKRLAMTQQPAPNFGQSWPGLVYLPITYFLDSTTRKAFGSSADRLGYFTIVGPHEVAHQWWGHTVGFQSYRDQWISEGFAEMSASIFIQFIQSQKNLDPYHKFWADERFLLNREDNQRKKAYETGPVTLGYRLVNGKSGGSVPRLLIYPKGGYILQMVRYMLRNERSNDPDVDFKRMMHEFVKKYADHVASTEDFKAILEKYMTPEMDLGGNHKMDWFFDEYVYGTDYPKYKFEHSFKTDGNGDMVVHFKLTQSNVSENFRMLVPLYVETTDGRIIRLGGARLTGNHSIEQDFPLKGLQGTPKRLVAAYYDDVLGDFENK
jgi:hypothetical protein